MSDAPAYFVTAPQGMLGRAWMQHLADHGVAHQGRGRPELDVTDPDSIAVNIPSGTRVVVNCAAYTDVDGAEHNELIATAINGDAVRMLAERCKSIGAKLVHFSTDYVFAGDAREPYRVNEPRHPISAYGRSKAAGEEAILASGCDYRLIRTSWLYAPWGHNFVRTMLRLTDERDELSVVSDQLGRPTSATHLVDATHRLVNGAPTGIYHVTDGGECTWHAFATEIARLAGHTCTINPCSTDQFPRPAKRPAYSVMDLTRTEAALGPMPHWKDNLAQVVQQLHDAAAGSRQ